MDSKDKGKTSRSIVSKLFNSKLAEVINKLFKNCMWEKWYKWMGKSYHDVTATGQGRSMYLGEKFKGSCKKKR